MTLFLDLNYHLIDMDDLSQILKNRDANFGYLNHLPKQIEVTCVMRSEIDEEKEINNIRYVLHKGRELKKYEIPFRLHQKIKEENPDYILIHGLRYGLYSFFLKIILKKKPILIVQEHGSSKAHSGIKGLIYKSLDRYVDGYFFTGKNNASSWVEKGIFPKEKIFELMEGSTSFSFDPMEQRLEHSYLWVGRLNENKDPLTIISAFEEFLDFQPLATLTIVYYNDTDLLDVIRSRMKLLDTLNKAVKLINRIPHKEIESYYQRHKFFVLGSHYEGSGYSLMEAMACGCVPIVTNIPSFRFMTNEGKCALLFEPENKDQLLNRLKESITINYELMQHRARAQFEKKLSHQAIANDVISAFEELSRRKNEI